MTNKKMPFLWSCVPLLAAVLGLLPPAHAREFLSEKEITELRDHQEIDKRTELYLKFAALRLDTFKERAKGIEPKEGDPLELLSLEDLITGYAKCLKSLQGNIDEALIYKRYEAKKMAQVFKKLKAQSEKFSSQLDEALKYAVAKKDESLYHRVNEAIEVTKAAIDGSNTGLEMMEKLIKDEKSKGRVGKRSRG